MERQLKRIAQKGLKLDMVQTYFHRSAGWHFRFSGVLSGVYCLHGVERVDSNRRYYAVSDLFSSIVAQIANVMALLPIISKGLESVESIGEVLCANDIEDNWKKRR